MAEESQIYYNECTMTIAPIQLIPHEIDDFSVNYFAINRFSPTYANFDKEMKNRKRLRIKKNPSQMLIVRVIYIQIKSPILRHE